MSLPHCDLHAGAVLERTAGAGHCDCVGSRSRIRLRHSESSSACGQSSAQAQEQGQAAQTEEHSPSAPERNNQKSRADQPNRQRPSCSISAGRCLLRARLNGQRRSRSGASRCHGGRCEARGCSRWKATGRKRYLLGKGATYRSNRYLVGRAASRSHGLTRGSCHDGEIRSRR